MAAPRFARLRLDQLNLPAAGGRSSRKKLQELKQSIEAVGILVPLIVRPLGKGEHAVIAGAGRLEALKLSGASPDLRVPCVVVDVDDARATLMSLVENTVREAMRPFDEAEVAHVLVREYGYNQQAVAAAIGRNQGQVSRLLAVLALDRQVVAALRSGRIGMRIARALLPLAGDAAAQRKLLRRALKEGLDAGRVGALVDARTHGTRAPKPVRYEVRGAGRVDARTTRSGALRVTIEANDHAGLARLLTSVRRKLLRRA